MNIFSVPHQLSGKKKTLILNFLSSWRKRTCWEVGHIRLWLWKVPYFKEHFRQSRWLESSGIICTPLVIWPRQKPLSHRSDLNHLGPALNTQASVIPDTASDMNMAHQSNDCLSPRQEYDWLSDLWWSTEKGWGSADWLQFYGYEVCLALVTGLVDERLWRHLISS